MISSLAALCALAAPAFSLPYFEDFNDGIADGWTVIHGDWSVNAGIYRGIGRPQPNSVHNISHVPSTAGTNYSVEAMMSTDPGFDDVNKMLVLRYNDPNNFYFVNFRSGGRRDVVVERVFGGSRSLLTPEGFWLIPQHGQTEMKRCRVDVIGNRMIGYFEGAPAFDILLTGPVIASGSAGINVFSSGGGGDEETYTDWFSVKGAGMSVGTSLEKVIGGPSTGALAQVQQGDNDYYRVSPRYDIPRNTPNIQLVWTGNLSVSPLSEARVRLETSTTADVAQQKVEVWDWIDSNWDVFDNRPIGSTDTHTNLNLGDLARYVGSGGEVKVRASYIAPANGARFDLRVDEINVSGLN